MKTLLFGKDGQLGRELSRILPRLGETLAFGRAQADFLDPDRVCALVREARPDIVINATGYTAVDKAESDIATARQVNATTVGQVAAEASRVGAWFVHYSTDYVFDGTKGIPYVEADDPKPLSVYGQTKLEGENAVRAVGGRHFVFRTSWVYAIEGVNFIRRILELSRERAHLDVVNDQRGTPTDAALIARVTVDVVGRTLASGTGGDRQAGTYHLTAAGETTWFDYAVRIVDSALRAGISLNLARADVHPTTTVPAPGKAVRPAYSVLSTAKLRTAFEVALPAWDADLDRVVSEIGTRIAR